MCSLANIGYVVVLVCIDSGALKVFVLQTKQVARMSEMMMITGKALKQAHRRPIIITTVFLFSCE